MNKLPRARVFLIIHSKSKVCFQYFLNQLCDKLMMIEIQNICGPGELWQLHTGTCFGFCNVQNVQRRNGFKES